MTVEYSSQNQAVREFLRNSGSRDMDVNGSSIPVEFEHQVSVETWITSIQIALQASSVIDVTKFGNGAALTNGILLETKDGNDTLLHDFTNGEPIKTNADFGMIAPSTVMNSFDGKQLSIMLQIQGHPIYMTENDKIIATIQDNLTIDVNSLTVQIAGFTYGQRA